MSRQGDQQVFVCDVVVDVAVPGADVVDVDNPGQFRSVLKLRDQIGRSFQLFRLVTDRLFIAENGGIKDLRLDKILEVEPEQEDGESLTVVIVRKGDTMTGLVVDNLIGQQEIVIKSLGKYIKNSKLISGATILGDGEVALILDVNTLM